MRSKYLLMAFTIILFVVGCQLPEQPVSYVNDSDIVAEATCSSAEGLVTFDNDQVSVLIDDLDMLEDKTYELWLVNSDNGDALSIGTFNADEQMSVDAVFEVKDLDVSKYDKVGVTIEELPTDDMASEEIVLAGDIAEDETVSATLMPVAECESKEENQTVAELEEKTEEPVVQETEVDVKPQEVVDEEVSPEEGTVIISEEGELIKLVPDAYDPDKDPLTYKYSAPFNQDGEWQTTYGDAGQYTVTVTVSDSQFSSSKDVLVVVNKKEEAPTIDSFSPIDTIIEGEENTQIEFRVNAHDLNNDPIYYSWKLDGEEVSTEDNYLWEVGFEDAGAHTMKLEVYDDSSSVSQLWSITIANVNRKPVLELIDDISVKENEVVVIEPVATDADGDELTFTISDPVGDDGEWQTTYDDAGSYEVTVEVSDGEDSVSQVVNIDVENVNRPPVITNIAKR